MFFGERFDREFGVRRWDGTSLAPISPPFTLVLNAPFALRAALLPPLDLNPGAPSSTDGSTSKAILTVPWLALLRRKRRVRLERRPGAGSVASPS